jgi:hypothetical protein
MFTYHVGIKIIKDNIFNQWTLHIQCKFHLAIFMESNRLKPINWMWLFFQNQNARVKCLFSHPNVFIINPLSYIALYFVILVSLHIQKYPSKRWVDGPLAKPIAAI